MMKIGTLTLKRYILQNTKRLRTFSRPLQSQIIPIDPRLFEEVSLLALIRFQGAFTKMAENNKSRQIKIELTNIKRLEVADKEGSLILEAQSVQSTLFFSSPINGTFKYYYNTDQKRFYSNKDGHLLDQNVSRQAHRYFGDILQL